MFLGDSLTEGIGYLRRNYIAELADLVRNDARLGVSVATVRLRPVGGGASRFVRFNHAADIDADDVANRDSASFPSLWFWNLACEGQTVESDLARLPLIAALRPSTVVVLRGALESVLRPAALQTGEWPSWVPRSWREPTALDPRCYFSGTWWRSVKQRGADALKQRLRLRLVEASVPRPLIETDRFLATFGELLRHLGGLCPRVVVCGLLPVGGRLFPGSPERFADTTSRISELAHLHGAEFLELDSQVRAAAAPDDVSVCFYRDGFHPNRRGDVEIARILHRRLFMNHDAAGGAVAP